MRCFGRLLVRSFGARKYNVQFHWGGGKQCTVVSGQRKQTIDYSLFEIQEAHNSISDTIRYYLSMPLNLSRHVMRLKIVGTRCNEDKSEVKGM